MIRDVAQISSWDIPELSSHYPLLLLVWAQTGLSLLRRNILYKPLQHHILQSCGIFTRCQVLPGRWLWLTRLLIHCNHIFIISPCEAMLTALAQVNSCLPQTVSTNCHLPRGTYQSSTHGCCSELLMNSSWCPLPPVFGAWLLRILARLKAAIID